MRALHRSALFILLALSASAPVQAYTYGALLKSELAYSHLDHRWQKQELELDFELNAPLAGGDLTMITRAMLDGEDVLNASSRPATYARGRALRHDASHGRAELRELFWEHELGASYWRLGKQQVVWGEADGLKLLDVVNPQSYREFILDDFDSSRIPVWMLNVEYLLPDESILQVLWIPDSTSHELAPAHSPFRLSSSLLVPQANPDQEVRVEDPQAPGRFMRDSDVGLRLARFWSGWDITLNYLYHYIDEPVLRAIAGPSGAEIRSEYTRSHLVGGSASTALDDWILRLEFAYESDRYHRSSDPIPGVVKANQWGSVIGIDYQGWTDQLLSVQWFQSRIQGHGNRIIKEVREDVLTLLWEHDFMNETLTLRASNLYSLDRHDGLLRGKLSYNLYSNLDVYVGADRFYGNRAGLFGQFDQADRVVAGFELGF